ncbi:hypothetical protein [Peribacillus sp. SI8-4]|uniref:hypothetical protein n=1 Tax=Peribacillus sp. SI8-4 TaxID=3048009 RepID=UPI0025534A4B|nr:hypothetical protein [Peribacillus sp. SI8-4]
MEWLFWRNGEEIPLGELKVKATHTGGKSHTAKGEVNNRNTPIKKLPTAYTPEPVSFNHGRNDVPVSTATTIVAFTETGIWNLRLYVHDQFIGDMKVSVSEKKEPITHLSKNQQIPFVLK